MSIPGLPNDLPKPEDDGACNHLPNTTIPSSLTLPSTSNKSITLSTLPGLTILFCYPRTAALGESVPDEWNAIPGARGCTPQACSFRDRFSDLKKLGVDSVFGLSTQDTAYQSELVQRTELPYELLSDEELEFCKSLRLPTFEWEGRTLIKRTTFAIRDGVIEKVWYPVFPPDKNVENVIEWLRGGKR